MTELIARHSKVEVTALEAPLVPPRPVAETTFRVARVRTHGEVVQGDVDAPIQRPYTCVAAGLRLFDAEGRRVRLPDDRPCAVDWTANGTASAAARPAAKVALALARREKLRQMRRKPAP